jgi:hypothetical protein
MDKSLHEEITKIVEKCEKEKKKTSFYGDKVKENSNAYVRIRLLLRK